MSIKNYLSALTTQAKPQANDKLNLILNNEYVIPSTIKEADGNVVVLDVTEKQFALLEDAGVLMENIFFTLDSEKAFNEVWKMVDSGAINVEWHGDTCMTNERDFAKIQEVLTDAGLDDAIQQIADNPNEYPDVEEAVDDIKVPTEVIEKSDEVVEDWGTSDTSHLMKSMWDCIDELGGKINPETMEKAAWDCAESFSEQMGYDNNEEAMNAIIGYFIRRPDGLLKRAKEMTIPGYNDDVEPKVEPGKKVIDELDDRAEDFDEFEVLAIHPDWRDSERVAIEITDCNGKSDFEKRWLEEPNELQDEFGYDLPLWGLNPDETPPKRREEMTYDEYVALVTHYIDGQANESLNNITRLAKGEHRIVDEAPKKPKRLDPLEELQQLPQPITVNGGSYSYTCDVVKNSHIWTASDGSKIRVKNIREIADWFDSDPAGVWNQFLDGEEYLSFLIDYGYVRPAKGGPFKPARDQEQHELNGMLGDSVESPEEIANKKTWETTAHLPMKDRFAQHTVDETGPDYMSEATKAWLKHKLLEINVKKIGKKKVKESFSVDAPYVVTVRNPRTGKISEMNMEKARANVFKGKPALAKTEGWNCSLWSGIPVSMLLRNQK